MRVAAVQFKARKGDPEASIEALAELTEMAARGSELVVLPEMARTGYCFPSADAIRPHAEPPEGTSFRALSPIARAHRTWIVCGYPERAGDLLFNSALVIDPKGELAFSYRKTLLYKADVAWASAGDTGYRRFESRSGAFAVGICMDLNDDAFVSWVRDAAVRVVAFPTNWVDEGENVWDYWAWRMEGTGAALVAANSWGSEDEIRFRGESAILDRRVLLAHAPEEGDGVLCAELP